LVVNGQGDLELTRSQSNAQLGFEFLRPDGTGMVVSSQHAIELGMFGLLHGRGSLPWQIARKTVARQVATGVELGKTHRNAAANGGAAVPMVGRAQEQTLASAADPGQHMRALQGHQRAVTTGNTDAAAGLALEQLNH